MDADTKSLLKSTILGLVAGGTISAIRAIHNNNKESAEPKDDENKITVPLSRKNFMRAVRNGTSQAASPLHGANAVKGMPEHSVDFSAMSSKELSSLKKSIIGNHKSASQSIPVVSPSSEEVSISPSYSEGSSHPVVRDKSGRFSKIKTAGMLDYVPGGMVDAAGAYAGAAVGLVAVKAITDRIMVNREKVRLEKSRKMYADMLSKEIEDEDTPYYTRKSAEDRGLIGSWIGRAGAFGLGIAGLTGLIMYKVLDNRRIAEEKAMDKDLGKYPNDKYIEFRFTRPEHTAKSEAGFFG